MSADWIDALDDLGDRAEPAVPEVALLGYPVWLGLRQRQRNSDLLRELQLIALDGSRRPDSHVPAGLVVFARSLDVRYRQVLLAPRDELLRAFQRGEREIDLRYPLGPESRQVLLEYARLMDHADEFCRREMLIFTEDDVELRALRRWTVEEYVRQLCGLAPRPWSAALTPSGG